MLKRLVLSFVLIVLLIALIGAAFVHQETARYEQQALSDLSSIAKLKAEQINGWLQERKGDAETLSGSVNLALRIEHYLNNGRPDADRDILLSRITTLRQAYAYDTVILADRDGKLLLGVGDNQDIPSSLNPLIQQTIREKAWVSSDLYREESSGRGHIHMDWVVPIFDSEARTRQVCALIILRTAPRSSFLKKLEVWPTTAYSAATLLVRREGEQVRYLNDLHRENVVALDRTDAVNTPRLPAAMAVRNATAGAALGITPSGQAVISAFQPVAGTDWWVVTQIDREEALQSMWSSLMWLLTIASVSALLLFSLLWRLLGQQQHLRILEIEAEKRQAVERLHVLGDNLPNGFVYQYELTRDNERRFRYLSAGIERLFGVSVTQYLEDPGKIFRDIDPQDMERYVDAEQRSAQRLEPFFATLGFAPPGRAQFWLTISSRPRRTADGGIIWDGVAIDSTALVSTQNALAASEERFRRLFEETAEAVLLLEDGRIIEANKAATHLLGIERFDEISGKTIEDFSPPTQDDGERSADERRHILNEVLTRGALRFEWQCHRADGTRFDAEVVATAMRGNSRQQIHLAVRDITEQKQVARELASHRQHLEEEVRRRTNDLEATASALRIANEEQQALFEAASVGIASLHERRILRCNHTLERLLGYSAGELTGKTTRCWYTDEATFISVGEEVRAALSENGVYHGDKELLRKDGERLWARISAQAIDPRDPFAGLVCIVEDISAERRAFDELVNARRLAEEAARLKSDFVANMSHEIRTPMNAIIGLTHLVMQTDLTGKQLDYLHKVESSSRHLLGIINDILDFSKIEAGKMTIEEIDFNLSRVLEEVTNLAIERAATKGIELIIKIDPSVPQILIGDPMRLAQILTNFLSNAVKFTEKGEICIRVDLLHSPDKDPQLQFSVIDTGIGISKEHQDHLFRSFEQADGSITRKHGGTGLGLAISQKLAALMDGEVGVSSAPGQGATFWCRIPLRVAACQAVVPPPRPDIVARRVLIADDNEHARLAIRDMLQSMSFAVTEAVDGREALTKVVEAEAQGEPFDFAFIDWKMPTMDGIETARELSALNLRLPPMLLMITAYDRNDVAGLAREAGISTTLTKPVTPSQLYDALVGLSRGKPLPPAAPLPARPRVAPLSVPPAFRVLVAEDNELNQQVAVELLHELGIDADIAVTGRAAIQRLHEQHYDLVFMDVKMPEMDGLAATREIRQSASLRDLPIIAMTANAMTSDRDKCLAAGMNDHLGKPIDVAELARMVEQWARLDRTPATPAAPPPGMAPPADGDERQRVLPRLRTIPGLDIDTGLALTNDRAALYLNLLRRFCSCPVAKESGLRQAFDAGDAHAAEREAHTLKGIAAQIGAGLLTQAAQSIEERLRVQGCSNDLGPDIDVLLEQQRTLIAAIRIELDEAGENG